MPNKITYNIYLSIYPLLISFYVLHWTRGIFWKLEVRIPCLLVFILKLVSSECKFLLEYLQCDLWYWRVCSKGLVYTTCEHLAASHYCSTRLIAHLSFHLLLPQLGPRDMCIPFIFRTLAASNRYQEIAILLIIRADVRKIPDAPYDVWCMM